MLVEHGLWKAVTKKKEYESLIGTGSMQADYGMIEQKEPDKQNRYTVSHLKRMREIAVLRSSLLLLGDIHILRIMDMSFASFIGNTENELHNLIDTLKSRLENSETQTLTIDIISIMEPNNTQTMLLMQRTAIQSQTVHGTSKGKTQ